MLTAWRLIGILLIVYRPSSIAHFPSPISHLPFPNSILFIWQGDVSSITIEWNFAHCSLPIANCLLRLRSGWQIVNSHFSFLITQFNIVYQARRCFQHNDWLEFCPLPNVYRPSSILYLLSSIFYRLSSIVHRPFFKKNNQFSSILNNHFYK